MRVAALADLHGRLDGVVVPPCDLVVIAGDLSPYSWKQAPNQVPWLRRRVRALARARRGRGGRAGRRHRRQPRLRAGGGTGASSRSCRGRSCATAEATVAGVRVYGSPWCPRRRARPKADEPQPPSPPLAEDADVPHWPPRGRGGVFMAAGEDELAEHFAAVPAGHRRPRHAHPAARPRRPHRRRASASARLRCVAAIERVQPPLAVFGHIHEGRGEPTHDRPHAVRELRDLRPLVRAPEPAVAVRPRPGERHGRARRLTRLLRIRGPQARPGGVRPGQAGSGPRWTLSMVNG